MLHVCKKYFVLYTCPGVSVLSNVMLLNVGPKRHMTFNASWRWWYIECVKARKQPGYSAAWRWLRSTSSWPAWNSAHRNSSAPSTHLSPEWMTKGVLIAWRFQPLFGSSVVLLLGPTSEKGKQSSKLLVFRITAVPSFLHPCPRRGA